MKSKEIFSNSQGKNIFLKNRSSEKLKKRIGVLTKWIWQIDHYSNLTHRQELDRNKYFNQKEAMQNELQNRQLLTPSK